MPTCASPPPACWCACANATAIAGGPDESICQPHWAPEGTLHFLSDRTGWWNLYRWHHHTAVPVASIDAELAAAPWEFGYSTFEFLGQPHSDTYRIATVTQHGSRHHIDLWHPTSGRRRRLELPYTSIKPYLAAHHDQIAAIAATPSQGPGVVVIDPTSSQTRGLTPTPHSSARTPETIQFPTRGGDLTHGLLHRSTRAAAPPPLIVRAHPGPTANAPLRFDPWTAFFTDHGFAVLDLDYHGSTGYGRAYRNALRTRWGHLDVTDCIDAVNHLTTTGRIDPTRIAITGSSAGGYTALRAIATSHLFTAAAVRHPVIDPARWRQAAPKFQQHHPDLLIGTTPSAYRSRSVFAVAATITTPLLITHGERDPITPITHARELAALAPQATLLTYPDEGHSLHHPDNITHTLTAELDHFGRHLRL